MIWDVLIELNIQIGCSPSKRVLLLLGHLTFSKELDSADSADSANKSISVLLLKNLLPIWQDG